MNALKALAPCVIRYLNRRCSLSISSTSLGNRLADEERRLFSAVLTKPVKPAQLYDALMHAIDHNRPDTPQPTPSPQPSESTSRATCARSNNWHY
jgi:hypothetical protein